MFEKITFRFGQSVKLTKQKNEMHHPLDATLVLSSYLIIPWPL